MKVFNSEGINVYIEAVKYLNNKKIRNPNLDVSLILQDLLNISKVQFLTNEYTLSKMEQEKFEQALEKRAKDYPLAYILNHKEFMNLDFYLDKSVLIPRADTETLVEKAIHLIDENNFKSGLEIGTGSACISVSLAYYSKLEKIDAIDISEEALKIAKKNARRNNQSEEINFFKSDVFENIDKKYDIIISNPPYISTKDMIELDKTVRYEPEIALHSGNTGVEFYEKIIYESKNYLNEKACLILEIGYDQAEKVEDIFIKNNFNNVSAKKDLAGLDRVVYAFN